MPTQATTVTFPASLDVFPLYEDGTGSLSSVRAEAWNKAQAVAAALEGHTQQLIHVVGGSDLRRLVLQQTVAVTGTVASFITTFTLTAAQRLFLGGQPLAPGAQIAADAYRRDAALPVIANVYGTEEPARVLLLCQHLDPTQNLTAAVYVVQVTLFAR